MNMFKLVIVVMLFVMNSFVFAQDTTLTVTSDGNVGIGTSAPAGLLEVNPGASATSVFFQGTEPTSGRFVFEYVGGSVHNRTMRFTGNSIQSTFSHDGTTAHLGLNPNGGRIGIGTTAPAGLLEVNPDTSTTSVFFQGTEPTSGRFVFEYVGGSVHNRTMRFTGNSIQSTFSHDGTTAHLGLNPNGGRVGIGTMSPSHPLEMASGAHVTAGGVWTDASSRALKENIRDLTGDEAAQALSQLAPKRYNYKVDKGEEYLGFIAEDVPELVATGNRKSLSPMDIVAVLTRVVQAQQQTIMQLKHEMTSLKHQIQK